MLPEVHVDAPPTTVVNHFSGGHGAGPIIGRGPAPPYCVSPRFAAPVIDIFLDLRHPDFERLGLFLPDVKDLADIHAVDADAGLFVPFTLPAELSAHLFIELSRPALRACGHGAGLRAGRPGFRR